MYVGRDAVSGKKRWLSRTIKGSKRDALALERQLRLTVEQGIDIDAGNITLGAYLERWLETKQSIKRRTRERYAEIIRLHVPDHLKSLRLSKLRPLHLQQVYSDALRRGLSKQTVLHIHRVLHSALRQAVRWEFLSRNVAEQVTPPRPEPVEVPAPSVRDIRRLSEHIRGTEIEMPVVLALGTGLRLGEVLGLRWSDVDLEAGILRVRQTFQNDGSLTLPSPIGQGVL